MLTIEQRVEKWKRGMQGSVDLAILGSLALTESPAVELLNQKQKMIDNYLAIINGSKWEDNLSNNFTFEEWKARTQEGWEKNRDMPDFKGDRFGRHLERVDHAITFLDQLVFNVQIPNSDANPHEYFTEKMIKMSISAALTRHQNEIESITDVNQVLSIIGPTLVNQFGYDNTPPPPEDKGNIITLETNGLSDHTQNTLKFFFKHIGKWFWTGESQSSIDYELWVKNGVVPPNAGDIGGFDNTGVVISTQSSARMDLHHYPDSMHFTNIKVRTSNSADDKFFKFNWNETTQLFEQDPLVSDVRYAPTKDIGTGHKLSHIEDSLGRIVYSYQEGSDTGLHFGYSDLNMQNWQDGGTIETGLATSSGQLNANVRGMIFRFFKDINGVSTPCTGIIINKHIGQEMRMWWRIDADPITNPWTLETIPTTFATDDHTHVIAWLDPAQLESTIAYCRKGTNNDLIIVNIRRPNGVWDGEQVVAPRTDPVIDNLTRPQIAYNKSTRTLYTFYTDNAGDTSSTGWGVWYRKASIDNSPLQWSPSDINLIFHESNLFFDVQCPRYEVDSTSGLLVTVHDTAGNAFWWARLA